MNARDDLECAGKAERRRRFGFREVIRYERIQSGVALRLPPRSKDAVRFNIAFEVLQSIYLAVVATILPFYSDLFRIRARSDRTSRRIQRNWFGDLAPAAMSALLRGWLRSGEVMYDKL